MRAAPGIAAPLALAALLSAAPAPAAGPGPAAPASPFALRPEVEITVLFAASAAWALPSLFQGEFAGGRCAPCDPGGVNALDRTVIGLHDDAARVASHVGVAAVPALAAAGALLEVAPFGWSAALEDVVLVAESIAVSGAVGQIVKGSVRRPRPYMYETGTARADPRFYDFTSFYSVHTTIAFAAATSFGTVFTLRRPKSPWRFAIWGAGLAAAAAVGACRVAGGEHFWTDVLAGAAAGGAIGALVPALHLRRGRSGRRGLDAGAVAGPGGAAVVLRF